MLSLLGTVVNVAVEVIVDTDQTVKVVMGLICRMIRV